MLNGKIQTQTSTTERSERKTSQCVQVFSGKWSSKSASSSCPYLCVQCRGSPALDWRPGWAGRELCPSRRCQTPASTSRRWSAPRPTRWSPTSTTLAPARQPAAHMDTCRLEASGNSPGDHMTRHNLVTSINLHFSSHLPNFLSPFRVVVSTTSFFPSYFRPPFVTSYAVISFLNTMLPSVPSNFLLLFPPRLYPLLSFLLPDFLLNFPLFLPFTWVPSQFPTLRLSPLFCLHIIVWFSTFYFLYVTLLSFPPSFFISCFFLPFSTLLLPFNSLFPCLHPYFLIYPTSSLLPFSVIPHVSSAAPFFHLHLQHLQQHADVMMMWIWWMSLLSAARPSPSLIPSTQWRTSSCSPSSGGSAPSATLPLSSSLRPLSQVASQASASPPCLAPPTTTICRQR